MESSLLERSIDILYLVDFINYYINIQSGELFTYQFY